MFGLATLNLLQRAFIQQAFIQRVLNSAQARILAWITVLMLAATIGSTVATRQLLLLQLDQRIDSALEQEAAEMRRLVSGLNPRTGDPFGDDVQAIFDVFLSRNIPEEDEWFVALVNGRIYAIRPRDPLLSPELQNLMVSTFGTLDQRQKGQLTTNDNTLISYIAYPLPTDGPDRGVFVVLQSLTQKRLEIRRVLWLEAQVLGISVAVALVLAWIATGRVLAPLQDLTQTARSIKVADPDLNQRIPVRGTAEIAELTHTFNAMLDRLQTSFTSQRNFINDASHELQTPITVIQGHLDLLAQHPNDPGDTLWLMKDELQRMSRLVKDLLLLATAERPDFLALELLAVDDLMPTIYAKAVVMAPRQWRLGKVSAVRIVADRDRLTQALMNLIKNAIEHTQAEDRIELGAKLVGQQVQFWVRDTGPGVSVADRERIFQRFARGTGKQRRSGGAGLGLAIVQAIAEAHGGEITLNDTAAPGTCFALVLPLEPPQETLPPLD